MSNISHDPYNVMFQTLQAHLPVCEYREIQCTQCGQYIQYLILTTHQEVECPMRPQPCQHCGKDVPAQQLQVYRELEPLQ